MGIQDQAKSLTKIEKAVRKGSLGDPEAQLQGIEKRKGGQSHDEDIENTGM